MSRFTALTRADGRVGVLDVKGEKFAHFLDTHPVWSPTERATKAAARLNDGTDTTTGYVWEKA